MVIFCSQRNAEINGDRGKYKNNICQSDIDGEVGGYNVMCRTDTIVL